MEYGIDVGSLAKGDVVSDETIREIVGDVEDAVEFLKARAFWYMNLKRALAARGLTARLRGDEVHVLADAEASDHNAAEIGNGRRKIYRKFRLLQAVDRSNLTREQLAEHDRHLAVGSAVVQGLRKSMRTLPKVEIARSVPAVRPAEARRRVL